MGLAGAALDEEPDIAQYVVECGHVLGAHVALEAGCAAVLPVLGDAGSSARTVTAHLVSATVLLSVLDEYFCACAVLAGAIEWQGVSLVCFAEWD